MKGPNFPNLIKGINNRFNIVEYRIFNRFLQSERKFCKIRIHNGLKLKILWFSVILRKPHVWEKSGSRVIAQNVFSQSDCRIL